MTSKLNDKFNRIVDTNNISIDDEKANKITFISFNDLIQSDINKKILNVDDELKSAIMEDGLLNPLIVKRMNNGKYEIQSGNRRYEAFKSILNDKKDFKYIFASNKELDPIRDGIPCVISNRELDRAREIIQLLEHNKGRNFDKLEIYNMVMAGDEAYHEIKEIEDIEEKREREYLANRICVSERTISSILADKWLINSKNIEEVKEYGSYSKYEEQLKAENEIDTSSETKKEKASVFNTEKEKLISLVNKYENKRIGKNDVDQQELDELGDLAIKLIVSLINTYELDDSAVIRATTLKNS